MSDARRIFGSIPWGRRLEQPDYDPNYQGTVGVLRPADKGRLKLARRNLREIPEKDIEGQGLHLVEKTSGETWEVITSFVDLVDVRRPVPKHSSSATAGSSAPAAGWKNPADESHYAGEFGGREAVGSDPMPMPTGLVFR